MIPADDLARLTAYAERVPGGLLTDDEFADLDTLTQRVKFALNLPVLERIPSKYTIYPEEAA